MPASPVLKDAGGWEDKQLGRERGTYAGNPIRKQGSQGWSPCLQFPWIELMKWVPTFWEIPGITASFLEVLSTIGPRIFPGTFKLEWTTATRWHQTEARTRADYDGKDPWNSQKACWRTSLWSFHYSCNMMPGFKQVNLLEHASLVMKRVLLNLLLYSILLSSYLWVCVFEPPGKSQAHWEKEPSFLSLLNTPQHLA